MKTRCERHNGTMEITGADGKVVVIECVSCGNQQEINKLSKVDREYIEEAK